MAAGRRSCLIFHLLSVEEKMSATPRIKQNKEVTGWDSSLVVCGLCKLTLQTLNTDSLVLKGEQDGKIKKNHMQIQIIGALLTHSFSTNGFTRSACSFSQSPCKALWWDSFKEKLNVFLYFMQMTDKFADWLLCDLQNQLYWTSVLVQGNKKRVKVTTT